MKDRVGNAQGAEMLPGYKEITGVLAQLGKRGQAVIRVNLVAWANDPDFAQDPPSCSVTVIVTDPRLPSDPILQANADIPTTSSPFQHEFIIPVETSVNVLKGIVLRSKPRALDVVIAVHPISGFEEFYEPDRHGPITIEAGTILAKSVALKPKMGGAGRRRRPRHSDRRQGDEPSEN